MDKATQEQRFLNIGLEPTVVKNTLSNPKVTASLTEVLDFAKVDKCDKKIGNSLHFARPCSIRSV